VKKLLPYLLVLVTALLFGCGSSNEQGIKDSREDFMVELKKALTENDIPFTVDDEGYVRYSKEHKEAVERIKRQVDERGSAEVGFKFEDELSTRYFRKLLDEKGIRYRAVSREDGQWTYWNPKSKQQQEEIEMEVVTHAFERQKGRLDNQSIQSD
jgi:hypothetical protein